MPYKYNPVTRKMDLIGSTDTTPEFEVIVFDAEHDNGDSGATATIDWSNGQYQKITLTDNCTFTFTDPAGPSRFILKTVQDAGGANTITWPAGMFTPGGAALTVTSAGGSVDIFGVFFDGATYHVHSVITDSQSI